MGHIESLVRGCGDLPRVQTPGEFAPQQRSGRKPELPSGSLALAAQYGLSLQVGVMMTLHCVLHNGARFRELSAGWSQPGAPKRRELVGYRVFWMRTGEPGADNLELTTWI